MPPIELDFALIVLAAMASAHLADAWEPQLTERGKVALVALQLITVAALTMAATTAHHVYAYQLAHSLAQPHP